MAVAETGHTLQSVNLRLEKVPTLVMEGLDGEIVVVQGYLQVAVC
jgi:hypothetical protein